MNLQRFPINEYSFAMAQAAMRDILYMYWNMASSYDGFGHNIETGQFDPYLYIDAIITNTGNFGIASLDALHQGSAVKILCHLSDYWDDMEAPPSKNTALFKKTDLLIKNERISHLPEVKKAIIASQQEDEETFRNQLDSIYKKYVLNWIKNTFKY